MKVEILNYHNGYERATIVTNGEETRTYTDGGCREDKRLTHAIHRLVAEGFYLDGMGTYTV